MNAARTPEDHWSLDKRIPIALIVAMLAQGGAAVWFFARLDGRVTGLETAIPALVETNRDQNRTDANILDRTTRLETDYQGSKTEVARRLDSIDDKLDKLLERMMSTTRSEFGPANRGP